MQHAHFRNKRVNSYTHVPYITMHNILRWKCTYTHTHIVITEQKIPLLWSEALMWVAAFLSMLPSIQCILELHPSNVIHGSSCQTLSQHYVSSFFGFSKENFVRVFLDNAEYICSGGSLVNNLDTTTSKNSLVRFKHPYTFADIKTCIKPFPTFILQWQTSLTF